VFKSFSDSVGTLVNELASGKLSNILVDGRSAQAQYLGAMPSSRDVLEKCSLSVIGNFKELIGKACPQSGCVALK
jgi:hypothetical protein